MAPAKILRDILDSSLSSHPIAIQHSWWLNLLKYTQNPAFSDSTMPLHCESLLSLLWTTLVDSIVIFVPPLDYPDQQPVGVFTTIHWLMSHFCSEPPSGSSLLLKWKQKCSQWLTSRYSQFFLKSRVYLRKVHKLEKWHLQPSFGWYSFW